MRNFSTAFDLSVCFFLDNGSRHVLVLVSIFGFVIARCKRQKSGPENSHSENSFHCFAAIMENFFKDFLHQMFSFINVHDPAKFH